MRSTRHAGGIRDVSGSRGRGLPPVTAVLVVAAGGAGGGQRRLPGLLDATARLRIEAVLLGHGPLAAELRRRGVAVSVLPLARGRVARAWAAVGLVGHLRAARADVVLAHGADAAVVALPAAWVAGTRAVRIADGPCGRGARLAVPADGVVPLPATGGREGADRFAAAVAEVAGRPGAGLTPDRPVTVLTCMRNEQGHVDPVIAGVVEQLGPDDEYLIVDDGSTDATPREIAPWLDADRRLRCIPGPGVNAAAARNRGIAAARHDIVACIDAGCVPAPGWLDAVRAPFAEDLPPALVVGVYRVSTRTARERAFAAACFPDPDEARHPSLLVRAYGGVLGRAFSADRLDGRSMAVHRDAWRAAGGFREGLASLEDAAFSRDVLAAGGRTVLAVDAVVVWEQHPTLRATALMYARYGRGDVWTGERGLVARDLARVAAYLGAPALAVLGGTAGRLAVGLGSAVYLSLPVVRAARVGAGVALRVPVVLAVKDVAKGAGCLAALRSRWRPGCAGT